MNKPRQSTMLPIEYIERQIYLIRGQRVMLDSHLARLYDVKAIHLRQQVKRNRRDFPEDFMFQLTQEEADILISQNVIHSSRHLGGFLPFAFTQEGVSMLSTVLRSRRAVDAKIAIMRAFVRTRNFAAAHKEMAQKLEELERLIKGHDAQIQSIFDALHTLMAESHAPPRRIGFMP
jgi:hypothetical protein